MKKPKRSSNYHARPVEVEREMINKWIKYKKTREMPTCLKAMVGYWDHIKGRFVLWSHLSLKILLT